LQKLVEWKLKDVKADINGKKRIGHTKRAAITKTDIGVPFGIKDNREE